MSVGVCVWCGQNFHQTRSDSLFCNPACKQKYWRWKHHLQLDRKTIMVCLDAIFGYLDEPKTRDEASLVLGEVVDRIADLGFVPQSRQLTLPEEAYTEENQLGGQDE